jgi:hypothetical protein
MTEKSNREAVNDRAMEVAAGLIRDFDITDRLIALESIIVGVVGSLPLKRGGDDMCLDMLKEGALPRLGEWRLRISTSKGTG